MKNQIGVDKSLVTLANAMFFHLNIKNSTYIFGSATTMKSLRRSSISSIVVFSHHFLHAYMTPNQDCEFHVYFVVKQKIAKSLQTSIVK